MTDLSFTVAGHDYSDIVEKGSYETRLIPVVGRTYTDLNKVEHTTIARYKYELTVGINVASSTRLTALITDLKTMPCSVTFYSFQEGANVTKTMTVDSVSMSEGFLLGNIRYSETNKLTFTEG